jgi:hypothetical protein
LAYKPACQILFIRPRRVVCASSRSDASMAALVRAAAARRGRTEGWDTGKGGAGAGGWRNGGGRLTTLQHRPPARAFGNELRPPRVVEVEDVHRLRRAAAVGQPRRAPRPRARHVAPTRTASAAVKSALPVHAAHVSQPAQLPARDIEVDRVEPQLLHQLRIDEMCTSMSNQITPRKTPPIGG